MATLAAPSAPPAAAAPPPAEDELRAAFRRAHDAIYARLARDPAAAFDLLSLTIAAKVESERAGAGWSAGELPGLIAAARAWVDVDAGHAPDVPASLAAELVELLAPYAFTDLAASTETDVLGTAYEAMVGSTFRGELGAYFTPWRIARFVAAFLDVRGGRVADPASGTGGLLLAARRHALAAGGDVECFGNDVNPRMVRAARLNFTMGGLPPANVRFGDGLDVERLLLEWTGRTAGGDAGEPWLRQVASGPLDAVVANPPFAGFERDPRHLRRTLAAATPGGRHRGLNRTLPFLEAILAMLRTGGVAGLVIPISVLNGDESGFRRAREVLLAHAEILGIVGLPEDAFVHTDCGVHGALLFLRRVEAPRAEYDVFVDWIDDVGYDRLGRDRSAGGFEAVLARHRAPRWPAENTVVLSELIAHDRLDPNWLRTARTRTAAGAGSVPLTSLFAVRDARIPRGELRDDAEYRFFEVRDADAESGEIVEVRSGTGADLRRKNRIRMRVRAGDVLLPNHRDSLIARSAPNGRSAVVVGEDADGALTSDRFIVLSTDLPPEVARLVLNAAGTRRQLVAQCRGAASLDLRPKALSAVSVPSALVADGSVRELSARAERVRALRTLLAEESAELRALVDAAF
ncbi:MAG TPA: N-6 DNA methylase [Solirubrobacteraceae bacterium]|jgi:hypothetical protein|nr:N-6 DNA methylase [Solirubrobacteraceae bacterium]